MEGELVVAVLMLHFVHVCVCISRCVYKLHKVQSQYSPHDMFVAVRVWYIILCALNMFSYYPPGFSYYPPGFSYYHPGFSYYPPGFSYYHPGFSYYPPPPPGVLILPPRVLILPSGVLILPPGVLTAQS